MEDLDISASLVAKSDQLNADDLIGGPITVRILKVRKAKTEEQPWAVEVDGGHRPWFPCKTVRRILAAGWGVDAKGWVGQRVTLYRDPKVKWGGQEVGGIRVAAMSGIKSKMTMALQAANKKKDVYTVEVLPDVAPPAPEVLLDLAAELAKVGLSVADFDAWRETTGKGPASALTPQEASKIAAWFLAMPARFEVMRPKPSDEDPEVPS